MNFARRGSSLALGFLLIVGSKGLGAGGPQDHMQQKFNASRRTATMSQATQGQHRAISRSFSSTVRQRQSANRTQARSLLTSQSGRHAPRSFHVRAIPVSTASQRVGIHDFGSGMGLARQGPQVGRGLQLQGLLAIDKRNQASVRQTKQQLTARSRPGDSERPDRLVGREGSRLSEQQRANSSGDRGRPGLSSSRYLGRR